MFRGYRLDDAGVPEFLSSAALPGGGTTAIAEMAKPEAGEAGEGGAPIRIVRRFRFGPLPVGTSIWFNIGDAAGSLSSGNLRRVPFDTMRKDGWAEVVVDRAEPVTVILEFTS